MCSGDVNFKLCITLLCGVTTVFQWQFILSIIGEITTILGIEVFTTKQEQQRRNLKAKLKAQAAELKKKKNHGKPAPFMETVSNDQKTLKRVSSFEIESTAAKPYLRIPKSKTMSE